MNKRKLATLVAASFASLMLSSPSFAANADKDKSQAAPAAAAQQSSQTGGTMPPKLGAPESRSAARADKRAAVSKEDAAAAKADYKAAIQKCDALPAGERSSCVQDAKDAQSLVMNSGSRAKRGAPESRSAERADKRAAVSKEDAAAAKADYKAAIQKCDALPAGERGSCVQDAKDAQSLVMNGSPAKRGAPESRIVGPQSAK